MKKIFTTFTLILLMILIAQYVVDCVSIEQISLSQRVTEKFAPEHVTCIATGVLLYDGDITKEGVQSSDNKIGFHDLKTGRGVVIENPFCVTTIPPDKYPELVPNIPKAQQKKDGEVKADGSHKQG